LEAKAFGESLKKYTTLNALPVGISTDNVDSHRKFIDKHGLNVKLLADPQKTVVRDYSGSLLGWAKRKSFLIDPKGTLRKIYDSVKPKTHAQEVLRDLEGLTELVQTLGMLETKNRQVLDSITAASHIQRAVLPNLDELRLEFKEFSLLWEPRDVVGGDCYWGVQRENQIWLGLFDCTGHGVPGAFVTLILLSGLFRIFQESENRTPGTLLSLLDRYLRTALGQEAPSGRGDDGADGAIVQWNKTKSELLFSGAKLPLWIQQADGHLSEFKPERHSLGYRTKVERPQFAEHSISLKPGFRMLLFTDGVTDEVGPRSISYGKRRLRAFLKEHQAASLASLQSKLQVELANWRGEKLRRDDLTFIGIQPF